MGQGSVASYKHTTEKLEHRTKAKQLWQSPAGSKRPESWLLFSSEAQPQAARGATTLSNAKDSEFIQFRLRKCWNSLDWKYWGSIYVGILKTIVIHCKEKLPFRKSGFANTSLLADLHIKISTRPAMSCQLTTLPTCIGILARELNYIHSLTNPLFLFPSPENLAEVIRSRLLSLEMGKYTLTWKSLS